MGQWLLSDDKALCILEADTLAEAQRFARERGHTSQLGDAAAVQRAVEAAHQEQMKAWSGLGVTEDVALRDRWGVPISPIPVVKVHAHPGAGSSSPAPGTASTEALRAQISAAVDEALREAGLSALATQAARPQASVTERRSSAPAAAQSQTMRKLVELRERDVSFEEEAVQAWRGLGFSEEAARRIVKEGR